MPEFANSLNPKCQELTLGYAPCSDVVLNTQTGSRCVCIFLLKREKISWMLSLSHLRISIWERDKTSFTQHKATKRCSHPVLPGLPVSARANYSSGRQGRRQQKLAVLSLLWALLGVTQQRESLNPTAWVTEGRVCEHQLPAGLAAQAPAWPSVPSTFIYCLSKGPCWALPVHNCLGSPKSSTKSTKIFLILCTSIGIVSWLLPTVAVERRVNWEEIKDRLCLV